MAATDRDRKLREAQEAAEDREEDPMSRARRRSREKRQRSRDDAGLLRRLVRRILP